MKGMLMKKLLSIVLIPAIILVIFTGCVRKSDDSSRLQIVCTVFPQYDFLRNIAGDKTDIKMLVPLGTESHDFKLENLTVAELKSISCADFVVYVGGESDSGWINELRSVVTDNGTRWVAMTDLTATLEEITSESMEHEHEEHEHDDEHEHDGGDSYDEHVWTSPKRAVEIVEGLTDVLCELDFSNAVYYRANSAEYINELKSLDERMTAAAAASEGKKLIFGDRFPFRYLCADYGIDFDAAFPGCSVTADPSVAQITSLTRCAGETGAKVIFYMENSKPIYAESIAKAVGAKAMQLHSCHTLSRSELDSGENYFSIMSDNIDKIAEAFS